MAKLEVPYTHQLDHTLDRLTHGGLLLAATREDGRSNAMVIGWGSIGVIWGLPVMTVLVRPSRYTYGFMEESGISTVNVPTPEMRDLVKVCGTQSGRDVDKLARVPTSMRQKVACVALDASSLVCECWVVRRNDIVPDALMPDLVSRSYPRGDFHRLYHGQILGTYATS